jgi:hypothetical protein
MRIPVSKRADRSGLPIVEDGNGRAWMIVLIDRKEFFEKTGRVLPERIWVPEHRQRGREPGEDMGILSERLKRAMDRLEQVVVAINQDPNAPEAVEYRETRESLAHVIDTSIHAIMAYREGLDEEGGYHNQSAAIFSDKVMHDIADESKTVLLLAEECLKIPGVDQAWADGLIHRLARMQAVIEEKNLAESITAIASVRSWVVFARGTAWEERLAIGDDGVRWQRVAGRMEEVCWRAWGVAVHAGMERSQDHDVPLLVIPAL